MSRARTILLLVPATLLGGVLAGSALDRVIVAGPAWHALGAAAWAEFSRHADLGTGRIAYPVEAIAARSRRSPPPSAIISIETRSSRRRFRFSWPPHSPSSVSS